MCFIVLVEVSCLILGQTTTPDPSRPPDINTILAQLDDGIIGSVAAGVVVGLGGVIGGGQFGNAGR
jgi:hypothetical protein